MRHPGHPRQTGDRPLALAFLATFLSRVLLAAAFFGLFSPVFGPALDQHFAERYPYHAHLFLEGGGGDHAHFYDLDRPHSHRHQTAEPDSADPAAPAEQPPGVIFLTSTDGMGHGVTTVANSTVQVDLVHRGSGGDSIRPGLGSRDPYPAEALVPPPEKPPQV
jgi:hypothetical protein